MVATRCPPPDHQQDALACPGCRQRDKLITTLRQENADLKVQLQDLRERTRRTTTELKSQLQKACDRAQRNSSNSSLPPSINPPDAPKAPPKKPSGRKPGGQPTWHQTAELPECIAQITEYQGHGRTCICCSRVTYAKIPEDIRRSTVGPRLAAALAYLSGSPHVSKRGLEEIADTLFQAPIALGTVSNLEAEMSAALQPAHAQAQQAVRDATVKNIDETGWKEAGKKRWLWLATTASVACFLIHTGRGAVGLLALLGGKIKGIIISDRWSVYDRIALRYRQICWAHLKRDFQKLVDLGGAAKKYGQAGLATAAILFDEWALFRGGGSRRVLQRELEPVRDNLRAWLEVGARCSSHKAVVLCSNLLKLEPALWTFLYKKGVEPTNNHGERLARSGVLWRKISFGCHSERGCRFVERILTVVQTLRLQQRPVLDFLYRTLLAHRNGQTPPRLVSKG